MQSYTKKATIYIQHEANNIRQTSHVHRANFVLVTSEELWKRVYLLTLLIVFRKIHLINSRLQHR
jgi:hypothetical protein